MESHKAKPMPNTLHFFYQWKDMYGIDFTMDKVLFSTVRPWLFVKTFKTLTLLYSRYAC